MTSNNSNSNEQTIYRYLSGTLHLNTNEIAGIMGNFQEESGFDPTASNPNEGAIGLAQWEGARRTSGLDGYAQQTGGSETSLTTQLGWFGQESASYLPGLAANSDTPQDAAAWWDANYERSSGSTRTAREDYAAQIAAQIGSNGSSGGAENWGLPVFPGLPSVPSIPGVPSVPGLPSLGKTVTSGVAGVVESVFEWLLDPVLIIFGVILTVVALVVFAHTHNVPAASAPPPPREKDGKGGAESAAADDAVDAAAL